jgi:hypothetical protein
VIEIRDVWTAARLLICHYDAEAGIRVSERIEMLAASGDLEGAEVWRSIRNAVDELQCQARRDGDSPPPRPAAAAPPGPAGGKAPHRIWAEFLHRYSRETPGAPAEKVNERGRDDEVRSRDSSMALP